MEKKVLLVLESGALKGIMQLEIINIIDEILQKTKLKSVLKDTYSDEIFKSLKDPSTGRPLVEEITKFCPKNSSYTTKQITSALNTKLMDYVDYTAGISIGAANSCGLTICDDAGNYKYTTQELIDAFKTCDFLVKTPWYNWNTKFEQSAFEQFATSVFRGATFEDVKKSKLMTISYNIDDNKQTIFTNFFDKKSEDETPNLFQRYVDVKKSSTTLSDAAVASASVQIAFPAKKMSYTLMNEDKIENTYEIDGGNIRNTPLMEAISAIINTHLPLKDLVVISIGTGTTDFDMSDLKDGSIASYLKNIVGLGGDSFIQANILCNGSSIKDMVADLIGGENFHDFNVKLDQTLFRQAFKPAAIPNYIEAAQQAFGEKSEGYKQLEDLAEYLLSLNSEVLEA